MLSRVRSSAIALGLIIASPGLLAQERAKPALENQPIPEARQEPGAEQSQGSARQYEPAPSRLVLALQEIESAIRDLIAEEDAQQRERQEHREIADLQAQKDMALWAKRMTWATGASVLLTLVGIFLIWRTLRYTKTAAVATVAMVDEAKSTTVAATTAANAAVQANVLHHRAWLKIVDVTIASAMTWADSSGGGIGRVVIRFVVKNIGNTPALSVHMSAELRQPMDTIIARSEAAARLRERREAHRWTDSITLFAGDITQPPQSWICSIPKTDIFVTRDGRRHDTSNKDWYKNIILAPILIVCVDYKLSFAEEYHQTWEVFNVIKKRKRAIIPTDGEIPMEELELSRMPSGGTFTN